MKKIEDEMFTRLENATFDFENTSVQDYLYEQIDDVTSINLFHEEKNDSCNDRWHCVDSQKIFLHIIISHLRFYQEHNLNTEEQNLLIMIRQNAKAINTFIQYHMNDTSLQDGLEYIKKEVSALKQ